MKSRILDFWALFSGLTVAIIYSTSLTPGSSYPVSTYGRASTVTSPAIIFNFCDYRVFFRAAVTNFTIMEPLKDKTVYII